jgi:hypothetical protein
VVEIDTSAERWIDPRTLRTLVRLELSDIRVPPDPALDPGAGPPTFFYRVLGTATGVRLELWELGKLLGSREIVVEKGNPRLGARRSALTAAELARRVALQRKVETRKFELARRREELLRLQRLEEPELPGLFVSSALFGEHALSADSWQVGAALEALYWSKARLRFRLLGRIGAGELTATTSAESLAVGLGAAWVPQLTRGLDLELGARSEAVLLSVPEAVALDAIAGQKQTWTARLALSARLEVSLSRNARIHFGPELGVQLRSVPLVTEFGTERLGGLWAGAGIGILTAL